MDYYDDKKRSKFRSDRYDSKYPKSNRYEDYDDNDEYDDYSSSSKKLKGSKHSRSRSRSSSRSRSTNDKYQTKSFANKTKNSNKYDANISNQTVAVGPYVEPAPKKFNPGVPSRTIMLRQLPTQIDDNEIRSEFNSLMVPYKDIRLVKHRDTGLSRGFAFVEFNTVEEAQRWMELTQGWLLFSNYDNKVQLFYSNSNDEFKSEKFGASMATEWDCSKCGIRNFKRRERCFKCGISKEESEKRKGGEGYDFAGSTPCNTILLRGLDALTSKETIIECLNRLSNYTLPVKNVHIARDPLSNIAMGFAFVEMNSIQDAGYLLQLYQTPFEIDGKQITINYSKNSFKTAITQLETQVHLSYNQVSSSDNYSNFNQSSKRINQADAANSAAAVAQAAMLNMHKKQEILTHITSNLTHKTPPTLTNQSLLIKNQDIDSSLTANLKYIANQVETANKVYQTPDVSQFVYDETSGYYYDYSTGFYYDANSQYYYNSLTQQYMYWDPVQSTYIAVTSTGEPATSSTQQAHKEDTETVKSEENQATSESDALKKANVKQTPKTAAQIAKDMEKWAQLMNKKKDNSKKAPAKTISQTATTSTSQAVIGNVVTAVVKPIEAKVEQYEEKKLVTTELPEIKKLNQEQPAKMEPKEDKEAEKKEPIDETSKAVNPNTIESRQEIDESSLIDLNKIACLLCKRKFDSVDILNKHIIKSDLHKTNLQKLKEEKNSTNQENNQIEANKEELANKVQSEIDSLQAALKYRDRAMERRKMYGSSEPPSSPPYSSTSFSSYSSISSSTKSKFKDIEDDSSSSLSNSYSEASTVASSSSVAAKLMKKMGWNEGSGIGKNLQGISAPIEATVRQKGSGLGSTSIEIDPNDSYQVAVKKSARARFEKLSN